MSYYGDSQWPAGAQPTAWDHQTPPTRSGLPPHSTLSDSANPPADNARPGASSTIPREEAASFGISAFWNQFEGTYPRLQLDLSTERHNDFHGRNWWEGNVNGLVRNEALIALQRLREPLKTWSRVAKCLAPLVVDVSFNRPFLPALPGLTPALVSMPLARQVLLAGSSTASDLLTIPHMQTPVVLEALSDRTPWTSMDGPVHLPRTSRTSTPPRDINPRAAPTMRNR